MISCSTNKEEGEKSSDSDSMEQSTSESFGLTSTSPSQIDIPVAVNLAHEDNEEYDMFDVAEYEILKETDSEILIETNSEYYKKYMSNKRFKADRLHILETDNSENVEFLTLELDIINNTDKKLSINQLNVEVLESKSEIIPQVYINTSDDTSNRINFVNQSWFNWKGFTFYYTILQKGEHFNGVYKNKKYVPYFSDYTSIDLLPDLKKMGYDFDGIVNEIRRIKGYEPRYNDKAEEFQSENDKLGMLCFCIEKNDKDFDFFAQKFNPFELKISNKDFGEYAGFATVYGKIKFDNSPKEVDFIADMPLSTACEFGGLSFENDNFNIKLKSTGNNYILKYPYTTVIEPYGSEFVKLTVAADKSSHHKFFINVVNDNGLIIRSKSIKFHYYHPKH